VGGQPQRVKPPFLNVDNRCVFDGAVPTDRLIWLASIGGAEPSDTPISAGQSTFRRRFRNRTRPAPALYNEFDPAR